LIADVLGEPQPLPAAPRLPRPGVRRVLVASDDVRPPVAIAGRNTIPRLLAAARVATSGNERLSVEEKRGIPELKGRPNSPSPHESLSLGDDGEATQEDMENEESSGEDPDATTAEEDEEDQRSEDWHYASELPRKVVVSLKPRAARSSSEPTAPAGKQVDQEAPRGKVPSKLQLRSRRQVEDSLKEQDEVGVDRDEVCHVERKFSAEVVGERKGSDPGLTKQRGRNGVAAHHRGPLVDHTPTANKMALGRSSLRNAMEGSVKNVSQLGTEVEMELKGQFREARASPTRSRDRGCKVRRDTGDAGGHTTDKMKLQRTDAPKWEARRKHMRDDTTQGAVVPGRSKPEFVETRPRKQKKREVDGQRQAGDKAEKAMDPHRNGGGTRTVADREDLRPADRRVASRALEGPGREHVIERECERPKDGRDAGTRRERTKVGDHAEVQHRRPSERDARSTAKERDRRMDGRIVEKERQQSRERQGADKVRERARGVLDSRVARVEEGHRRDHDSERARRSEMPRDKRDAARERERNGRRAQMEAEKRRGVRDIECEAEMPRDLLTAEGDRKRTRGVLDVELRFKKARDCHDGEWTCDAAKKLRDAERGRERSRDRKPKSDVDTIVSAPGKNMAVNREGVGDDAREARREKEGRRGQKKVEDEGSITRGVASVEKLRVDKTATPRVAHATTPHGSDAGAGTGSDEEVSSSYDSTSKSEDSE